MTTYRICYANHRLNQQNAYGNGTPEGVSYACNNVRSEVVLLANLFPVLQTGAENHQQVCPVQPSALDAEKAKAQCDRDEGDIVERLKNAAQSYMEWLPLRRKCTSRIDGDSEVKNGCEFDLVAQICVLQADLE